jgi:transcriptional regulator with XRE-family HTH domain
MRELRKLQGVSQLDLAQHVPCVRTYISKYEAGFIVPKLRMLEKLAAALKVDLYWLLDESISIERLPLAGSSQDLMIALFDAHLDTTGRTRMLHAIRSMNGARA